MLKIRKNLLLKVLRPFTYFNHQASTNEANIDENESESFGKGGKFVKLDTGSKKLKNFTPNNTKPKRIVQTSSDKVADESDKFGTLTNEFQSISFKSSISTSKPLSESIEYDLKDEENEKKFEKVLSHIRLTNDPSRPNTDNYYASRMKKFAEEGKISDAVSVFYDEMIDRDRYRPTLWLYKILIKILARAGYTHMAFAAFKKLTDSGDDDWTSGYKASYLQKIVTLLFLSCSNCKWKDFSIQKTDSIRFYLKNRDIIPNTKMYSAMILSYGKSDAIYEAFNVVDEMLLNNVKPDIDIFSNLLCACISDKKYGFKYAMNVWQLCLKAKLKPNLTMYNLLLKATNDCSLTGVQIPRLNTIKNKKEFLKLKSQNSNDKIKEKNLPICEFVPEQQQNATEFSSEPNEKSVIEETNSQNVLQITPDQIHVIEDLEVVGQSLSKQINELEWWQDIKTNINRADLLTDLSKHRPELNELAATISYKSFLTSNYPDYEKDLVENVEEDISINRFNVLGGVNSLIRSMKQHKVDPDFKTFNMMLEMIPDNLESEELLAKVMDVYGCKPNLDFINILMKRRIFRKEYSEFDKAFNLIQEHQLSPNIQTFGVLAYNVKKLYSLKTYLDDLKKTGFELNPIIISTLFTNGIRQQNDSFLIYLCNYINENNFKINDHNLKRMESLLKDTKDKIISFEKNGTHSEIDKDYYNRIKTFYNSFKPFYTEWIARVKIEEKIHPYQKFARDNDKLYHSFIKRTEKLEQIN